jgi:threonylcarbamoyladenosine tRNA methylthiotransferase MtaB
VVEKKERVNRSKQLRILSEKLQRAFYAKYINSEHTALFEQDNRDGMLYGFTDNYIKVKVVYNADICRTKRRILLTEIDTDGIMKAKII